MGESKGRSADALLATAVFAASLFYLARLPRILGAADEGIFLYEATRILAGEVMYRDFFEFFAPGAWYLMALAFALFGATIQTADLAMACVHGAAGAVLYLASRALGGGRLLSLCAPAAYLAVCFPAWPYASPHWLGSALVAVLLLLAAGGRWAQGRGATLGLGLVAGSLVCVEHHRGLVMVLAVAFLFAADELLRVRLGGRERGRLTRRAVLFACGALAVALPVFGASAWLAGVQPLYEGLIVFPLRHYGATYSSSWGAVFPLPPVPELASLSRPTLLAWSPLPVAAALALAGFFAFARPDAAAARAWLAASVVGGASLLSVLYYPDFVHLALAAPAVIAVAVAALGLGLRAVARAARLPPAAPNVVGLLLLGALAASLASNARRLDAAYAHPVETPFGRVALRSAAEVEAVRRVSSVMRQTGSRELFVYPHYVALYLLVGGRNPTPFSLFHPATPLEHGRRAVAILEQRRTPQVVIAGIGLEPGDPVLRYLDEHYDFVEASGTPARIGVRYSGR